MNRNELSDYSAYIITEYYKNNTEPFLNSFSEKCLWIGPAQGQIIQTKEALLSAFKLENNQLTFDVQNLHIIPIPVNSTSMDVVLTYTVISYYPNGEIITCQQRTELLWVEENITDSDGNTKKDYQLLVCHISNEIPYDSRDTIYPNHFTELNAAKIYAGKMDQCKFSIKGLHNSYFYLSANTIMWIESKGRHTLIHTTNNIYESTEKISAILEKCSDILYRIHVSYAINPAFVSEIGRFYVQMDDGSKLSIPEKKYTATRDKLNSLILEDTL